MTPARARSRGPLKLGAVVLVIVGLLVAWELGVFERVGDPGALGVAVVAMGVWGYLAFMAGLLIASLVVAALARVLERRRAAAPRAPTSTPDRLPGRQVELPLPSDLFVVASTRARRRPDRGGCTPGRTAWR